MNVDLDPRRIFSKKQRAEIFEAHEGKCGICDRKITAGENWVAGHVIDWALGGPTTVENGQPECGYCSTESARESTQRAAKAKRQGGETGQQAKRRRRKHNPWQTDKWKKKINGRTEKRDDKEQ